MTSCHSSLLLLLVGCTPPDDPGLTPDTDLEERRPDEPADGPESTVILDLESRDRTAFSAAVTLVDGQPWTVVEHARAPLRAANVEVVGPPGSTLVSALRLLPLNAHYPTILVDGNVLRIVAKETAGQARPDLEIITQPLDLSLEATREPNHPEPTGIRAGRPAMTAHDLTQQLHLCWTAGLQSEDQDVFVKAWDGGPWADVQPTLVAGDPDAIEDHCDVVFDEMTRWLLYQSDAAGHSRVGLRPATFDGTAWNQEAALALPQPPGLAGATFPSIDSAGGRLLVAAAALEEDRDWLLAWTCSGACRDSADWDGSTLDPPGDRHNQPKALLAGEHALLFYRTERPEGSTVDLSTRCAGTSEWTHHGPLELPGDDYIAADFATVPASAVGSVAYDDVGERVHTVFVATRHRSWNAIGWSAPLDALCPPQG